MEVFDREHTLDSEVKDIVALLEGLDLKQVADAQEDAVRKQVERIVDPLWRKVSQQRQALEATQRALRNLRMEFESLRREPRASAEEPAATAEDRRRQILEAFPPEAPPDGYGIFLSSGKDGRPTQPVDCAPRLHLCKAACCRIYRVHLTASEARSPLPWDENLPYVLRQGAAGCVALEPGTCGCAIYKERPGTCRGYSCRNDANIWEDFEQMRINPELTKRLASIGRS